MDRSQQALKKTSGTWNQTKTELDAFDIPLRFVYSITLADEFQALLFAGPNLNYALTKTTTQEQFAANKISSSVKSPNIYKDPTNYSALDLQMGAGMGVKYYGVSIRASYDWGILNRTTFEDATLRSNDIKVSLAYTF